MTDKPKNPQQKIEIQAAPQPRKSPAGAKISAPPPRRPAGDGDFNVNDEMQWAALRRKWVDDKLSVAAAHAERVLMIDHDDLPLSKHILLLLIAAFCGVFMIWASFATLDEVTRGEGKIIPSSEIQTLSSLEGGIVDDFQVKEGDTVHPGQILMRLRDIEASSDLGSNRARYLGLLATVTRLQAEAEGKESVVFPDEVKTGAPQSVAEETNAFNANRQKNNGQLDILKQQLTQREAEVRELNSRASDLSGVISVTKQQRDMIAPAVARGSAPKMELLDLERTLKQTQTDLNGVRSSLPRARAAVEEAKARIKDIETTARAQAQTDLSAKLTEMNSIKETLAGYQERKGRTEIRSPVEGIVKDIKVNTVGGAVKPGQDVIEIVPQDDQLLVEAKIRPSDIAFLHPGQKAMVKITAYDFSIYGGLKGHVVDISADTIANEKGENFYRVRVRTDEKVLKRKGEVLPIIPGMVATVDIMTGHKTVMEYLLKPFIKTLRTAMNER